MFDTQCEYLQHDCILGPFEDPPPPLSCDLDDDPYTGSKAAMIQGSSLLCAIFQSTFHAAAVRLIHAACTSLC